MKTILIIDDDVNLVTGLETMIELDIDNIRVISANSGREGLGMAFQEEPDLIILDMGMPDMNGEQVLAVLHQRKIPSKVIVLSGRDNLSGLPEVHAHIAKPVRPDVVIKAVKQALA